MSQKGENAYAEAGVDIEAGKKAVELIKPHIRSTYGSRVLSNIGSFAGLLDVSFLKQYQNPVLAMSCDGPGTKIILSEMTDNYQVGRCIVNHNVNDILCSGAHPIAFLNYLGSAKLEPEVIEKIVAEMAVACRELGIPIISGETAEMPSVYQAERHEAVGFIVGVTEKDRILDGSKIREGDALIGLPSNGLHTSGYSLARKAFFETAGCNANTYLRELGCTVGEELLKVHKCYLKSVERALAIGSKVHAMAHITGGGFYDNIGRLLEDGLCAEISGRWKIPSVFRLIQRIENLSSKDMRHFFNLGVGFVLIVPPEQTKYVRGNLWLAGETNNVLMGKIKKTRLKKKKVVFTY
ncbi:MAG: phosphoribosylformylglycinamidine cyclo-ligase [Candidatus Nealsonbacteria bacterium CG09_land_8_20_14_0_10_42_14]|uniref:Phosphoribosylformylglycinamidine cyclo-ligase n=1 Tax=Candidatus Nealsonbacteria bacterium CG09_land_8_20_14_0_10_42_14 TaxID=1974707 RepID=A0A2H0WXG6_9BACT|nr:MAG: phosphoribosylformylglycinamidine cyclo-ligase [Candidatus Nealsonbacteria bacterium CG09_land_8_20_14_0_10_42_14]